MWTRLVEIVQARWQQSGQSRQRRAKGAMMLYGAMSNCREAFLNYKRDRSETNFSSFVFSIDALISTLQNLNHAFELFDRDLTAMLQDHALGENRAALSGNPQALARRQIKVLRNAINLEFDTMEIEAEVLGEFDDALEMLAAHIRRQFTLEDVFSPNPRSTGDSGSRHASVALRQR